MKVKEFIEILATDFYTGVPDSLLAPFCNALMMKHGTDASHHVIAANEGNAVGLAAGYHLATGRVPVVYLQNSGEGNIINPLASLLHREVYGIPVIFVIGWRGEPGVADEPQHVFQGMATLPLLGVMGVPYFVVDAETSTDELETKKKEFDKLLRDGRQVAFVIRKGSFTGDTKTINYQNEYALLREAALESILDFSGDDCIVATTGKISREIFEIRKRRAQGHDRDFLTVGSMGHASSIALSIALQCPDKKVWCIDGDGAALMHMGAFAIIGQSKPKNLIHVLINNVSHESVGGLPTAGGTVDFCQIARGCGYSDAVSVADTDGLQRTLTLMQKENGSLFLEVKVGIGSRADLGRPDVMPKEVKVGFMRWIGSATQTDVKII